MQDKRIVILGGGESGVGAALLANQQGYDTFLSDNGLLKQQYKDELEQWSIAYEENGHTKERVLQADEVVKSPGIPSTVDLVEELLKQDIPVISEIEFASRYTDAFTIGITGSNGKTTTTALTYYLLQKAGLNVGVAGNIGKSFARQVATAKHDYYVVELSSFQLDHMYDFRANVAVLTNITPDHLDRYEYQLENYVDAKFRITQNQQPEDTFIYCADDELTTKHFNKVSGQAVQVPFSIQKPLKEGAWLDGDQMSVNLENNLFTMQIQDLALPGKHNTYNSMAAAIVGRVLSIRKEVIRESLSDFENVEHRLEKVVTVQGVDFINDSKATNVNSAWYALESIDKPLIWIAGGVDKGNDYSILKSLVREKVRIIICMGLDNRKIHEAFSKDVEMIINTTSAEEAVHVSHRMSRSGEAVLLSPACASFDLFENYEERGRQFKKAVRNL